MFAGNISGELNASAGGGMLAPFQSFLFNDGYLSAKRLCFQLLLVFEYDPARSRIDHVMFVFVSQVRKKRAIDARVKANLKTCYQPWEVPDWDARSARAQSMTLGVVTMVTSIKNGVPYMCFGCHT